MIHKKSMARQTEETLKQIKKWRNEAKTKLRRKALKGHWKKKADNKTKPTECYKVFKPYLDAKAKGTDSRCVSLEVNGVLERDQETVANYFANHFASVATNIGDPQLLTKTVWRSY